MYSPIRKTLTALWVQGVQTRRSSRSGGTEHNIRCKPQTANVKRRITIMIHIPVLRWGEPYSSLDVDKVVHFATGEPVAEVGRANAALVDRDMRHAQRARDVLREIPIKDILQMVKKAGDLYAKAE